MIRLDAITRKLQVILAGAVATNQLPVTVCYSDKTTTAYTGGTQVSTTNGGTAVDVCAAPAASTIRDIDTLVIQNADTAEATVTVRYNDNGALYTLFKAVLAVEDQLTYAHGTGWRVVDSAGALKSSASASDVVTLTATQTLTNKTLTSPTITTSPTAAGATWTDLGSVTTCDINGGTIDGTTQASGTINGPIAAGGTWTAAAAWTLPAFTLGGTVTSNGQSFSGTIANLGTVTTADINGGTIDGAVIGGSSAAAATVTSLTDSGNLTFTGTGNRITGDFSNSTIANRVMFQTSTVNGVTVLGAIPSGTGGVSALEVHNASDPANSSSIRAIVTGTEARVDSPKYGTGTFLPMTFHTGGSERMRIDTSGNVGIGVAPVYRLDTQTAAGRIGFSDNAGANRINSVNTANSASLALEFNALTYTLRVGGTATLVIDASGNVTQNFAAGLGYGTGAGGTVTQGAGSGKATAVTLNKPTGRITTDSASLAAGASINFIVYNTVCTNTDVVVVNAGDNANYVVSCVNTAGGAFRLRITNITAGPLSEAFAINFAIIKGASS